MAQLNSRSIDSPHLAGVGWTTGKRSANARNDRSHLLQRPTGSHQECRDCANHSISTSVLRSRFEDLFTTVPQATRSRNVFTPRRPSPSPIPLIFPLRNCRLIYRLHLQYKPHLPCNLLPHLVKSRLRRPPTRHRQANSQNITKHKYDV